MNLYTKTTTHTIIKKSLQTPSIHIFNATSLHNHAYNTHFLKTDIYHFIHYKPSTKIIASYIIISAHIAICKGGWKSPASVSEHKDFWPRTTRPKDMVRYLKSQK